MIFKGAIREMLSLFPGLPALQVGTTTDPRCRYIITLVSDSHQYIYVINDIHITLCKSCSPIIVSNILKTSLVDYFRGYFNRDSYVVAFLSFIAILSSFLLLIQSVICGAHREECASLLFTVWEF